MADSEKISPTAGIDLTSLINMFVGGSGSKSGTTTTKGNISEAGIQDMVKKILSSDTGLAAIAQGERRAGLYNSTVNQSLVTKLVTDTAGELASRVAGTTTTQTGKDTTDPKINPLKAGGALALYGLLSPSINELTGGAGIAGGIANAGASLAKLLFGDNGATDEELNKQVYGFSDAIRGPVSDSVGTGIGDIDWTKVFSNADMMDPSYGE